MAKESHCHDELSEGGGERKQAAVVLNEVWAELEVLRREIDASWQSKKTAVELISEQRR